MVWDNLQNTYAGKIIENRLGAFNNHLNAKYIYDMDVRDHVCHAESQLYRMGVLESYFESSLKVSVLHSSVGSHREFSLTMGFLNRPQEESEPETM